jgi:chromosome segregation ATPase
MQPPSQHDPGGFPALGTSASADDQLDDILSIVDDLRRQLKNSKDKNAALVEERAGLQKRLSDAEERMSRQTQELERNKRLLTVCQTENETLLAEAVDGQEEQQEAAREIQSLRQEVHRSQERIRSLDAEIDRLKRSGAELVEQANTRAEPLRQRVEELEEELQSRSAKFDEQAREVRRLNVTISDLSVEKEQLQAQVEVLERYRKAMSRVHGALRGAPGEKKKEEG